MRGSAAQRRGQPLLHLGPGDRVERGEGLVERQQRLAGDEGAEEGDPLAHAARELGRGARLEAVKAEALEQRAGAGAAPRPAEAAVAQRQRGVVERRVPGQQQVALGHVGAAGEALARRSRRPRPRSCRRSAPAGRRPAPAASTCRSRRGRPGRAPRARRARGRAARSSAARRRSGRGRESRRTSLVSCRTPRS